MSGALLFTLLATVSVPWSASAADPLTLGTAGEYSVLASSTVTNTGGTTLGGSLGLSPGTAVTGFPPGQVGGASNLGPASPALQAQSDLTAAYNEAAGLAPDDQVAGDLVGLTFFEGVYNSSGPLDLTGTVTLDGQGNPNAVFVFQVSSTLTTGTNSEVLLTNGARACNVYWQVGSSATVGTSSTFVGTILALTSITVTTDATVQGRALARSGAVTLDNNEFVTDSCDVLPTAEPTATPTVTPSASPSATPTVTPSATPTTTPSAEPTATPTAVPSPTGQPTSLPTEGQGGPSNAPIAPIVPGGDAGSGGGATSGPGGSGGSGASDDSGRLGDRGAGGNGALGVNRGTNVQTAAVADQQMSPGPLFLGVAVLLGLTALVQVRTPRIGREPRRPRRH